MEADKENEMKKEEKERERDKGLCLRVSFSSLTIILHCFFDSI